MNDDDLTRLVEAAWNVTVVDYAGEFAPVDAYTIRDGRLTGYVERKTRNVTSTTYPTAILDTRKWLALLAAEFATGLPAVLAYGWSDGLWGWVRPSLGIPVTHEVSTPGDLAVSLNRGVPRPVVHIPVGAFTFAGVATVAS